MINQRRIEENAKNDREPLSYATSMMTCPVLAWSCQPEAREATQNWPEGC